jgi:hypothetical protein
MVIKIRKVLQEKVTAIAVIIFFPKLKSYYLHKVIVGAMWSCHLKCKILHDCFG